MTDVKEVIHPRRIAHDPAQRISPEWPNDDYLTADSMTAQHTILPDLRRGGFQAVTILGGGRGSLS
jgi:hypothetical protein